VCCTHTQSVATTDTELANSNPNYERVSRAVMAKCSDQWRKISRSTSCADIVREKLNTGLVVTPVILEQHSENVIDL